MSYKIRMSTCVRKISVTVITIHLSDRVVNKQSFVICCCITRYLDVLVVDIYGLNMLVPNKASCFLLHLVIADTPNSYW